MLKKLIKSQFRSLFGNIFKGVALCYLMIFSFAETSLCQSKDTTYIYYKSIDNEFHKVSTVDSADFIKVLYPSDPTTNTIPVKQFYSNGKINFVASYDLSFYNNSKMIILVGDYISYYANGKKQSYVHYTSSGNKDGLGYIFYPNGKVYCSKKYAGDVRSEGLSWDCFDNNGLQICKSGNGQWITCDSTFKPILQGPVKDGLFDGEWHGKTFEADSIKYTYIFKKGKFISGTGYDKFGKQYPFFNFIDESSIKSDPFTFVYKLHSNFKIPNSINIRKSSLDTALVSFILEKNGRFSNVEIVGNNNPELRKALQNALDKCTGEKPKRYYGVPLRSKITISFKDISETNFSTYYTKHTDIGASYLPNKSTYAIKNYTSTIKTIKFKEEILGFD